LVYLALMAKVFDAVPPAARIILLGDKDQLASVEAGYVLGDICNTGETIEPSHEFAVRYREATGTDTGISAAPRQVAIQDFIIELRKSYRFRAGSGISRLSTAINAGDGVAALGVLGDANGAARRRLPAAGALPRALRVRAIERYRFFLEEADPAERLKRFGLFRVLCAVRRGPYGVVNLNGLIAQALEDAGILSRHGMPWYAGRPVMVTQNDYGLKLYNGDIGIALPDAAACGELRVFFLSADGELRRLLPSRIPAHETAFAMTVHKSQGSEFDHVLLILPDEDVPVLTRELLYTAVTRARESMEIWCGESVLRSALARQQTRTSGLREALWGDRSGAAKPGM
jgi:exodeoxyribonuclease V alpha subunit